MSTAYYFKHSHMQIGVQTIQNKHGKPLTKCFTWNINPGEAFYIIEQFQPSTYIIISENGHEFTKFDFVELWNTWDFQHYDKLEPPA